MSILSPEGSHARTSASRGAAKGSRASDRACSSKPSASFAFWNPDTSSWRTCQRSLFGGWMPFSGRWPRSGMTRSGTAYKLPTLARRISATGSSFWGTPTAHERTHSPRQVAGGVQLANQAADSVMWPTPRCADGMISPLRDPSKIKDISRLEDRVALHPTPTVSGNHNRKGSGPKSGDGLATFARRLDEPNGESTQRTYLNPEWVEWLMGFPIGWTDLEDLETPSSPKSPNSSDD